MRSIIEKVIEREGGDRLTKDPDDPGGTTKYGISQRANPDVDIESLTLEGAIDIYKDKYWDPSRAVDFPRELMDMYFDMVVNFGQGGAVKVLQQSAVSKGHNIAIDGGIGPATLKAIQNVETDRVRAYRVLKFARIVIKRPT